ncbi:hypothetical protein SAMN02745135_00206 [Caloranaerobacter azorensis DSM 13643]|uniref:Coenzyme PQQ synthesis protein D (PqqD) n=1 Tax=Caloranaerobacter azorensis DSM 13643 TaxID=1121264 RepID=A0A1M5RG61_9FIRM|nr:hypothetical protein [Caloranaerobacter azorensis]SHH25244.1 hypothetical protein SAMN02745135_00206 [Caloranaerobacter azorensis DSM 13643]
MYLIDKATKWFIKKDYLELYHPENDDIVKIECEKIDQLWKIILISKSYKEIIFKVKQQNIDNIFNEKVINSLLNQLEQKKYIVSKVGE